MGGVAKSVEYRLIQGEGLSFRASVPVLAALDQMVRDGVKAFPQRGLEVGGILMGLSEGAICLEAVRPLPMEYRTSPAFRPSPADLLFVKQSVFWAQASETGILGHFRSQTSGEPGPTEADQTIADLLKLPEPLLMLIPASAAGVEPARVYRQVNGKWVFLLDFPLMDFPAEPPTPQAMETRPPAGPALPMAPFRSRWRTWALVGLVGLGCGAVLSHSIWKTRPAVVLPTRSDLHLQFHPDGTRLRVQWDPASRAVADGFSGILTVQDGGHRLQIPLDRQQLHAGSTFYIPESGWVEVRLEIYRDGNHYTGEAMAMATGMSTPQSSLVAADPAPKPDVTDPSLPPEKPAAPPSSPVPPIATQRPRKGSLTAPQTALPPSLPAVLATTPARPLDDPSGADSNAASFSPAAAAIRYETAVPIRKVRPGVPAGLHSLLSGPVSIEIKVEIDTAGMVASATPVGSLTGAQKLLAPQAVDAARLWRFQPARKNGEPVASESLLKFDFEPDAR
jgi:periplasmic protein TonB